MKNINTQTIATDFQQVVNKKTSTVETSSEDFKKALQHLVGEEISEEETASLPTDTETPNPEDDQLDLEELPLNILATIPPSEPNALPIEFDLEAEMKIESPVATELAPTNSEPELQLEMVIRPLVKEFGENSDSISLDIFPESITKSATNLGEPMNLPNAIDHNMQEAVSLSTESETLDSKPTMHTSIIDAESTNEVEYISQEKVETKEPIRIENKQTSEIAKVDTADKMAKPTEKTTTTNELKGPKVTENSYNTDISASGQLTQMKIAPNQPQVQTQTVKVIPQEQLVQEIETMIVEDLGDTSQIEKVSTTKIQLTPKHLGEMTIELVMKNKELTAHLIVEKVETKQWLEQSLTQLMTTLTEQNIKVEQFDVQVASHQTGFMESSMTDQSFFKEQERAFHQKNTLNNGSEEKPKEPERIDRNERETTGRLSIWA